MDDRLDDEGEENMGAAIAARVAVLPSSKLSAREIVADGASEVGRIRIPEFLLFFLLFFYPIFDFDSTLVGNTLLLVISVYALTRKPTRTLGSYRNLLFLIPPALLYIAVVSMVSEHTSIAYDWQNRFIRIGSVLLFVFVASVGRIDLRSGVLGFLAAAFLNVPLFYAGLTSDAYSGALTGIFFDKNVAGLAYALAAVLTLIVVDNRFIKYALFAVFLVALWQTGSRTSMGAVAGAAIWYLLSPRLNNVVGKLLILGFIYWGIGYLTQEFSQSGVFEDRVGSDALRERIDEASQTKLDHAGIWGMGLGEAVVELQDRAWSFHNSYWSALVEGGYPWLAFVLILTFVVMIPFWKRADNGMQVLAEGLGVVVLVTSIRLGEVFLTNLWAVAFAMCLFLQLHPIDRRTVWEKYADSERERREQQRSRWSGQDRVGRDWRADHAARVREIQEGYVSSSAKQSRRRPG